MFGELCGLRPMSMSMLASVSRKNFTESYKWLASRPLTHVGHSVDQCPLPTESVSVRKTSMLRGIDRQHRYYNR
jgi:hypothetical protein